MIKYSTVHCYNGHKFCDKGGKVFVLWTHSSSNNVNIEILNPSNNFKKEIKFQNMEGRG